MISAESFAKSILLEKQGIHLLIWDDKGELVRALIILFATLDEFHVKPMLLSSSDKVEAELRQLFELKPEGSNGQSPTRRSEFLILFLQQAASQSIGPLLNGWRSALKDPPGTLLIVRNADLVDFQRSAPDLASFIGPKMIDSSNLLSIWTRKTAKKIQIKLPTKISQILEELPGEMPNNSEIKEWIDLHPAIE